MEKAAACVSYILGRNALPSDIDGIIEVMEPLQPERTQLPRPDFHYGRTAPTNPPSISSAETQHFVLDSLRTFLHVLISPDNFAAQLRVAGHRQSILLPSYLARGRALRAFGSGWQVFC